MPGRDPPAANGLDRQFGQIGLRVLVQGRVEVTRSRDLLAAHDTSLDLLYVGQNVGQHLLRRLPVAAAR